MFFLRYVTAVTHCTIVTKSLDSVLSTLRLYLAYFCRPSIKLIFLHMAPLITLPVKSKLLRVGHLQIRTQVCSCTTNKEFTTLAQTGFVSGPDLTTIT